jgi:hypothetical protein
MSDYRSQIERRIGQFCRYLKPMDRRAHEEASSSCFLIFENHPPGEDPERETREERDPALAAVAEVFGESGGTTRGEPQPPDLPEVGWREEGSRLRFVQFAFEKDWFCIDLPRQTLSFDEALEILWHDRGFFYLRDKPQFTLRGEPEGYDPFRKIYLYGDEALAAEDTAFVFFRVWGLPVDSRLYVTAASFSSAYEWERGVPLE